MERIDAPIVAVLAAVTLWTLADDRTVSVDIDAVTGVTPNGISRVNVCNRLSEFIYDSELRVSFVSLELCLICCDVYSLEIRGVNILCI
jgi:hypothetical protein